MISSFAKIKFFSSWLKTMDYSKAFDQIPFRTQNSSLEGATELKSQRQK